MGGEMSFYFWASYFLITRGGAEMINRISGTAFVIGVAASLFSVTPVLAVTATPGTFGSPLDFNGFPGDKCALLITDFGAAKTCSSVSIKTTFGTPSFTAGNPEESGAGTSLSASDGGENESAAAAASADFGALHAYGQAQYGPLDDSNGGHGYGFASFSDELTVLGTNDVTVTFTSIVEGAFQGDGDGVSQLRVLNIVDGSELGELDINAGVDQFDPTEIKSEYVTLQPGHTYVIFDEITAAATADSRGAHNDSFAETADLSGTGLLYIDGPAGTLSFLSGHDYSTPSIGDVPEPSTWAMMILGFCGVGALLRRRKQAIGFGNN
jgi:hypothetical protein